LDQEIFSEVVTKVPLVLERGLEIYVEDGPVHEYFVQYLSRISPAYLQHIHKFNPKNPKECCIDFVLAFGGDGLLMHCNTLFETGSIPPTMCFDFGSLGFLAPFAFDDFEAEVSGRLVS
jgi:NAD kinase